MNALSSPRFDLYGPVHKGLRAFLADTLQRIGSLDVEDPVQLEDACNQALDLLATLRGHVDHEDEFIHPLLERCRAGAALQAEDEHVAHRHALEQLAAEVRSLQVRPSWPAAEALYQSISALMAENLLHMRLEDIDHQALLWQHCTDDELMALDGRIVGSIAPREMMLYLRWMIPAMSPPQRLALMLGLRAQAPVPVHTAVSRLAQQHLPAAAWARLQRDIERAEAPVRIAS